MGRHKHHGSSKNQNHNQHQQGERQKTEGASEVPELSQESFGSYHLRPSPFDQSSPAESAPKTRGYENPYMEAIRADLS